LTASLIEPVAAFVVPLAAAVMMFCLGLNTGWGEYARAVRRPLAVGTGLVLQLLMMPLLAAAMARLLRLEPTLAIGIVLVSACPIATPANFLTRLAGGSVALAITLTALTSLLAAFTVPWSLAWTAAHLVPGQGSLVLPPLWRMTMTLFIVATAPALLGVAVRCCSPRWAARVECRAGSVAGAAFVGGVTIAIAACAKDIPAAVAAAGPYVLILSAVGAAVAYWVGGLLGIDLPDRLALVLGVATRKFSMAAVIALTLLREPSLLSPAIAYGLLMWLPAGAVVLFGRRRSNASRPAPMPASGLA
jgi:BASS family bile acid:Na+ symporter